MFWTIHTAFASDARNRTLDHRVSMQFHRHSPLSSKDGNKIRETFFLSYGFLRNHQELDLDLSLSRALYRVVPPAFAVEFSV